MTINLITLGCSKNVVDSEKLLKQLEVNGFVIFHNTGEHTDVVIINTCAFTLDAKTESVETILSYCDAKESGLINKLFIIGCLNERYKESLKYEMPVVDGFYGVNEYNKLINDLGGKYHTGLIQSRVLTTPSHYAYLKISEGCNRNCSFCAIPFIRGNHLSVPVKSIVEEANNLVESGVKEIILIAQDLSSYGLDLYKSTMLASLIEELVEIKGIEWIRLHYAYPEGFPLNAIGKLMKNSGKLCHYLDIPFQHINDDILNRMKRGHGRKEIMEIIRYIREEVPGICLRTTLITGFPGETEDQFRELYDFVSDVRFERLGVFTYSHEEGTFAGREYQDDIPENEKIKRMESILKLQERISLEKNLNETGKRYKVLIDGEEGEFYIGRTEYDSPEIDQEVLIPKSQKQLETGEFYNIRITDALEFDLFGMPDE